MAENRLQLAVRLPDDDDYPEPEAGAASGTSDLQQAMVEEVVIVEDVLTSGISLSHTTSLLKDYNIKPLGAIVGVDRNEHAKHTAACHKSIRHKFNYPIHQLLSVDEILTYALNTKHNDLMPNKDPHIRKKIKDYLSSFSSQSKLSSN